MPPRLYVDHPLEPQLTLELPAGAARHAQVLRLQPGQALTLFDARGGEWTATVLRMGRSDVTVRVEEHHVVERELGCHVTLALGVPANERMDGVVEKATELGVQVIQPLECERSVLRLSGDRAQKKLRHWQAVALAACEQSGRTRVPIVAPMCSLESWLAQPQHESATRWMLSLASAPSIGGVARPAGPVICVSGPEGGSTPSEEASCRAAGFEAVSLGPRVLRADTAPLAVLAYLGLSHHGPPG